MAYVSFGQELDTLRLDDIAIYGASISKYTAGSSVLRIEKREGTLNNSISDQLPIYFKNYGNGQLSTAAFRGTSASQTAVLWNGVQVNSPTLGQTDFSLWPTFLIDEIAVQMGSSGALYGSGAIGGTVLIESSKPTINDDLELSLLGQAGSFGRYTSGVSAALNKGAVTAKTRLFYHILENDFEYQIKGTDGNQRQNNAAIVQYGLSQDLYFHNKHQQVAFHGQFIKNDREIQPSIANNSSQDELQDYNLRLALDQSTSLSGGTWSNTLAYIVNDQYYNKNSRVVSQQFTGITNYSLPAGKSGSLRVGANINHFTAETENYYTTDWMTDLYASYTTNLATNWRLSLNLRQSLDNNAKPFAPSLGMEYAVFDSQKSSLTWKAQAGRSYRLPTLNDKFWQPGGNLDLQAEESLTIETGIDWTVNFDKFKIKAGVNVYRNWVDEWIIWLPNELSIWSPDNIRDVRVSGVEFNSSINYTIGEHELDFTGGYAFAESIIQSGLGELGDESVGKQLPYVPEHQFHVRLTWGYKRWQVGVYNNYTGSRFTTDDNSAFNQVDEFNLVDVKVGKRIQFHSLDINASIQVQNLMDVYYENLINRAMPGRNYTLNFLFTL